MITDTDIKKLKGVFATKTDLKKFATRDDLKKLQAALAAKTDLNDLQFRFTQLDIEVLKVQTRMEVLMSRVDNRISDVLKAMDGVAKGMDVMKHEYTAVALKSDRHANDKSVHLNPIRS